ncbi:kelch repeat-containing protein [Dyadobacter sp. 3J3]|uniref:Kelch repeat-containing protein n=1 Tax=Dyadobacter sp. 3J3 TaxID=2606600 RepID=UPI00135C9816|nr:kelch repeat-containing protein [Dyadobacter sp. 3J3]
MFNTLKKSSLTLLIASTALFQFGCDNSSDPDKVGNWYKKGVPSFGGTPRTGAVSFLINNIGYIGGGYTSESVPRAKDFWSYDAATKIWSQVAPYSGSARTDAVAFVSGGKAYVGTGYDGVIATDNGYKKDFYQYTPLSNSWKAVADFPGLPRQYASAFTVGDVGYVGLGYNLNLGYYQDVYKYDAAADKWTEMATFLGGKRRGASTFTIGNIAYVGFGTNNSGTNVRDLYQFEPAGNSGKGLWTQKTVFNDDDGTFPTPRANALGLVANGLGYIIGGAGNSDVWEYDATADIWLEKTPFPGVRGFAAGFVVNNIIYFGTGGTTSARYDDFWGFDPTATNDEDDDVN